ncbi:hypothetical protein [Saccharophagus degradans]|uniref:Uncharacterized protein n=2 Tax=Saccharophagus degradans TaxID=86304 RepID=Q21H43_SACD2|nr:hypothetical protein [Saccharophagus degradans]ABD81986.1 hypothetical protein Sde_2726 [Saccharophagus degradans 2-40]MBU2987767.1 hypothetical protein [Saccharophagus degradans]MDO6422484.1 hypothetical protein [Saccharophagus degradans]MDO6606965.1 hypothetical protein [Saccharophagus degradans]WGO99813.1 hypothetical protein QFX18_07020 [Saccharophagus degradans]
MKKWLIAFTLISGFSGIALAGSGNHEEKADKIISKLELDDGRATEVRAILEATHTARKALHEEMREKQQALHAQAKQDLATVLTEEELAKFDAIMEKKKDRMKDKKKDRKECKDDK